MLVPCSAASVRAVWRSWCSVQPHDCWVKRPHACRYDNRARPVSSRSAAANSTRAALGHKQRADTAIPDQPG